MTEADVRELLADKIAKQGLRPFCREHDLDPSYTMRVLGGKPLSPAILTALGVEEAGSHTTYKRTRKGTY